MTPSQQQDQQDQGPGGADDGSPASAADGQARSGPLGTERADATQRTHQGTHTPAPRRPDERDESTDRPASAPRPVIQRAHQDLAEGQVDTDQRSRGAGALMRRLRADDAVQDTKHDTNPEHAKDGT
jgi:hypothetical protein